MVDVRIKNFKKTLSITALSGLMMSGMTLPSISMENEKGNCDIAQNLHSYTPLDMYSAQYLLKTYSPEHENYKMAAKVLKDFAQNTMIFETFRCLASITLYGSIISEEKKIGGMVLRSMAEDTVVRNAGSYDCRFGSLKALYMSNDPEDKKFATKILEIMVQDSKLSNLFHWGQRTHGD